MLWWTIAVMACASPPSDAETERALDQLYSAWSVTAPGIPTIDAETLQTELKSATPPILVDAREPHEIAVSRLPGAIDVATFEQRRATLAGRKVVVYCTVGVRSGYLTKRLRGEGVEARNFRGSILAWTHLGGPLVGPDDQPTTDVHVYGKRWNYAHSGYAPFVGDPPRRLE